jgi:hypothetical protein
MRLRRLLLATCCLPIAPATAFTFSDGSTMTCYASGKTVAEVVAAPDDPVMAGRTGWARRDGDGWVIVWNAHRLKTLTPELHDFLFFHECAHASLPTDVEVEANCVGLVAMRASGRAGPAVESRLRALFPNNEYWRQTFSCADAGASPGAKKD